MSVDRVAEECRRLADLGVTNVLLFGIPESKDPQGSGAWDEQGPVCRAVQADRARHRLARRARPGPVRRLGHALSLDAGLPPLVAVLMGVITASFGGVLRDIVCNEIPTAFRDHRPYAMCAFAGGWVVVAVQRLGGGETATLLLGTLVAFGLRALALHFDWRLPAWHTD